MSRKRRRGGDEPSRRGMHTQGGSEPTEPRDQVGDAVLASRQPVTKGTPAITSPSAPTVLAERSRTPMQPARRSDHAGPVAGDAPPTGNAAAVGEFARHAHQYQRDYIAHADAKAGVIGTASVGLLAFLEARGALDPSDFQMVSIADWLGAVSAVVFFLAALFSAGVLWPRLKIGKRSIPPGTGTPAAGAIFWEEVLSHGSHDAYETYVAGLGADAINGEIATHTYVLAGINRKKYRALSRALRFLIVAVAVALLCAFLFVREAPAKVGTSPSTAVSAPAASPSPTSGPTAMPAASEVTGQMGGAAEPTAPTSDIPATGKAGVSSQKPR